ncbi:PKD domain-containing protein, partial [candidate division WOR-3 bacterium]|nr:PKD domain-containing protein [candidate division WOR-3 bacterium]
MDSRFKKFNRINIGVTHISDDGIVNNYISPVVVDGEFVYITVDFSTIIINGMTGTTTTTLTGLSGNQSISVPNGSSYDLNITNNHPDSWTSTDGKNYTNKSIITINGSMVTTETGIPLQLFTNLEGVDGTGDIGIVYTNLTAIPREIEAIGDNDNVSLHFPFNTTSGIDSQFVVLWGSDNNTEPPADSTYGSQAVWSGYEFVSHMNIDPNTAGSEGFLDSTLNANHGTPSNFESGKLVDFEYGKKIVFGGVDEYITLKNAISDTSYTNIFYINTTVEDKFVYDSRDSVSDGVDLYIHADEYAQHEFNAVVLHPSATSVLNRDILLSEVSDGNDIYLYGDDTELGSAAITGTISVAALPRIGARSHTSPSGFFVGSMYEIRILNTQKSLNFITTTYKNLNNPTATGTDPFYKLIGNTQTAPGTVNITVSITGDSNEQSYNTSQSREFTLTPTGITNNVLVNTTSTDYDVTVTTYWTENTTLQSETTTAGYAKQYINYTPSFNITSADLNTTFTFNFSAQDYIGTAISTLDDVSKPTTIDGQDVNASVGSLTAATSYWWNVTVPYNNIFTLSNQSDITAFLGVSKQFNDSTYNDPEGLPIDSRLWYFGDGGDSSSSNPNHTYVTIGNFNANYSVTETATVSPQTIVIEFNVSVEVQPPQNVTTVPHQTNVSINWDDYAYADKYSVYELEDGFPYVDTDPVMDGIKDVIYDYAHEFLIFSPNPINPGDYETIYPLRTSLGAYVLIESVDNDDKLGDDDLICYFDPNNNGLTINDPAWKITNNAIKKYLWDGDSWQVTGVSDAVGASTGGGTHYPIHELFIPIAELGANWTNGSTVKVLVKREDSSL